MERAGKPVLGKQIIRNMGNYTYLRLGKQCEIEAKNALPVVWLALFEEHDFKIEARNVEGDAAGMYLYTTSAGKALRCAETARARLHPYPHVYRFLRPLDVLISELQDCDSADPVELEATQFARSGDVFDQRLRIATRLFSKMLTELKGDAQLDEQLLLGLVKTYALYSVKSLEFLSPLDRMFLLFGMYWGKNEDKYSVEYLSGIL